MGGRRCRDRGAAGHTHSRGRCSAEAYRRSCLETRPCNRHGRPPLAGPEPGAIELTVGAGFP